jgi:hypothetical protein
MMSEEPTGQGSSTETFSVNRQTAFFAVTLLLGLAVAHVYWLSDAAPRMHTIVSVGAIGGAVHDGFFLMWGGVFATLLVVLFKSCKMLFRWRPVLTVTENGVDFQGADTVHVPSIAISRVYEHNTQRALTGRARTIRIMMTSEEWAKRVNRALPFPVGKVFGSGNPVIINSAWIDDPWPMFTRLADLAEDPVDAF